MKCIFAMLVVLAAAATPVHATGTLDGIITPSDRDRLDGFDAASAQALAEARAGGSQQDIATLDSVVGARRQSFEGFDMSGNWQCRTIKAGGLAQLVVYGWFKCRVSDDGSGWILDKLTGSQRTTGSFFDDGPGRLIYLGSGSVNDDKPLPYGAGPDSDQVGYAFRTGRSDWYIAFPSPRYESKLDIMQFRR